MDAVTEGEISDGGVGEAFLLCVLLSELNLCEGGSIEDGQQQSHVQYERK